MESRRAEDNAVSGPQSATPDQARGRVVIQSRYGGPEVLRLAERPRPCPTEGEVLVRVHAASVNARDWHVMRGEPRLARLLDRSLFGARRPRVQARGTDLAGIVEAVGNGVTAWQPGDAVFGEGVGTFADYAVASADQLAAVPAGTSFQEAATLPLAATTALLCLDKARLKSGSSVLVNGASGGVGTFAIQVAKTRGLHVTAVVSTRNVALARSTGADAVIDYTTTDFARTGHAYDAVVDLVGNRRLRDLRRSVRPGGSLVLSGGGTPGNGRFIGPLRLLIEAQVVSRFQPFEITVPQAMPDSRTLAHTADLVGAGNLRPLIDRTFPLQDAAAAIRYVETEHPRGKVILTTA